MKEHKKDLHSSVVSARIIGGQTITINRVDGFFTCLALSCDMKSTSQAQMHNHLTRQHFEADFMQAQTQLVCLLSDQTNWTKSSIQEGDFTDGIYVPSLSDGLDILMSSNNRSPSHIKEKDISDDEENHIGTPPSLSLVTQRIYTFIVYLTTDQHPESWSLLTWQLGPSIWQPFTSSHTCVDRIFSHSKPQYGPDIYGSWT